jgi:type I restriction enzyme S subunit
MSRYTISPTLNKSRVFILQKSELEKRFDPQFYKQEYKDNLEKIKRINYKRLGEVVKFSTETWNQKDFFDSTFPYIEISEIDTISGEIQNIVQVEKEKAASRAKMIVRENDIIISTTRPNRGAISLIRKEQDFSIASTGFSVIRNITNPEIDREYLFTILRQQIILKQFEQRSSGGNYPAITQEELCSVTIPLPEKETQKKIVKVFNGCFAQKQKNEAEADNLLSSIDDYLLNELGIKLPEPPENTLKNRMFVTNISELSGSRFDPHFNKIFFKEVFNSFSKGKFSISRIKDVLDNIKTGTTPHQKLDPFTDSEGVVFLRNTNLKKYHIDLSDTKYVKTEFAKELTYSVKGEVIMCIAGTVGLSAINDVDKPISINQNVSALKFDDFKISPDFASYWFNTNIFLELTKRACSVATIFYLNNDNLKLLPMPVPPLDKQKEIAEHITGIRQQAQQLKDKTNELLKKASEEIEEVLIGK